MNLSFPQLLFGSVGALLIYAAITGKMPNAVVKAQLKSGPAAVPNPQGTATTTAQRNMQYSGIRDVGPQGYAPTTEQRNSLYGATQVYP